MKRPQLQILGNAGWTRAALAATLLLALGAGPATAAATLGEIYALALQADAQYAAAKAAAAAGREKSAQGRAGLLPTVSIGGNIRHVHETGSTYAVSPRNYDSGQLALTMTQPLFRKVNYETYQQGELQALLAEQQLRLAEQDLLLRVARGYFDVLQAQDVLSSVLAQKDAFAQQLAQAKRSFEVGLAPITDVNEAQSRHDLTLAQEIASRNDLELKRRVLEKAIDRELPELARLDDAAPIDVFDAAQLKDLVERAPENSLQVAAGLTSEQVARREIARQEATVTPTVDLVVGANESHNGNFATVGSNTVRQVTIGLDVGFPIYQGGANTSRTREALANLERAQQELANARRQARLDARQASLGVASGSALHQALRQALSSSESQVRSTRRGLEVGVRTRVDVLNAEQQLYATKKDLAASRYQTLVAGLQLRAAAGVLAEADLRALDKLLVP